MTGEKVCRCAHLDYTKVATPLRCDDIAADITEMQSNLMTTPEELVMWEHQWDWLIKPYVHKGRRSGWTTALRSAEEERTERHRPCTLFGVKVRFADD
jgi:hypothetical protein